MNKERKTARVHNDMLQAPLGKLNEKEIVFLLNVLYSIKDKGTERVHVPFSEFTKLTQNRYLNTNELLALIDTTGDKLQEFKVRYEDSNGVYWKDVIFPRIGIDEKNREVLIEVNDSFAYIVNWYLCKNNFTQLACTEIAKVRGKYSKLIYWYLKRFSDIGVWSVKEEEFRELLNIPKSYKTKDIHRRIIKPSLEELTEYFSNIQFFEKRAKGNNKAVHMIFTYDDSPSSQTNKQARESLLKKIKNSEKFYWIVMRGSNNQEDEILKDCPF